MHLQLLYALCATGLAFDPRPGQTKTFKLAFAASRLSMQHLEVKAMTGRPRVRIMCPAKVVCLPVYVLLL